MPIKTLFIWKHNSLLKRDDAPHSKLTKTTEEDLENGTNRIDGHMKDSKQNTLPSAMGPLYSRRGWFSESKKYSRVSDNECCGSVIVWTTRYPFVELWLLPSITVGYCIIAKWSRASFSTISELPYLVLQGTYWRVVSMQVWLVSPRKTTIHRYYE